MVIDKYDDEDISEHGNWNVAMHYAEQKIMKPLMLADEYERIATFGSTNFYDELVNDSNIDILRIKGFQRLVKELMMVINNSLFAVKKPSEKDKLKAYLDELKGFSKIIKQLFSMKLDQRTKISRLVLRNDNFDLALDRVTEIKALINEPLNRHDLIFTYREEFDPEKAKAQLIERATTRG